MKKIYKLINEEISKFNFLGVDDRNDNIEINSMLEDSTFQKKLILDYIDNSNKLSFEEVCQNSIKIEKEDENRILFDISYIECYSYDYDSKKKPISIEFGLFGNDIVLSKIDDDNFKIDWSKLEVSLSVKHGDEIDFIEYNEAPQKIKNIVAKKLGYDIISETLNINLH